MTNEWNRIQTARVLQPVTKPAKIRNLGAVSVEPLQEFVKRLPESFWIAETAHRDNDYDVFGTTQHAVFRFFSNTEDPRHFYSKPGWYLFETFLTPILDDIATRYDIHRPAYPKVMLAKLLSGGRIENHIDDWGANALSHKIHVPLISDPAIKFRERQDSFYLEPGYAYEVNNLIPHGAVNDSRIDRIHLIFELFDTEQ